MSAAGWVGVFLLGGAGAVLRHLVDGTVTARVHATFPVGILLVNLTGAAVLGALAGAGLSHDAALLAGTALVGAYTTFSTWMTQTVALAREDRRRAAAANLAVSLVLGLGAVAAGRWLCGRL